MGKVRRAVAAISTAVFLISGSPSFGQYLTGGAREQFIKANTASCMREKIKDQEAKIIPNSLFETHYCRCYASTLADRIPAADLMNHAYPTDNPTTRAASQLCYQTMKAEALRLYKEGRYPKE
ncbi:hypothetical protein [Bradyrhizobium sp. 195]|uniref:hypothetical protein n=1 Tax=Bradyrhizobium sp. 195 TaxID=2782662 RepID=UPI002001D5E3|nr:hypothetical protein [Bradyrhizobium sp. 195]UPK28374.1 hypothetical protein IVB26_08145 [Bradyrhizobium sp. 195]